METSSTTYTVISQDPVSSLRAAALSTLKAKRRKTLVEKSVSLPVARPPPPDAIQLDYGQEDNSLDTAIVQPTPNVPSTPPTLPSLHKDTQMREEGEISDEEESPVTAERPKSPTPPQSVPGNSYRLTPEPVVLKIEDLSEHHTFLHPLSSTPIPPESMPVPKTMTALLDRISDRVSYSFEEPDQVAKDEPLEAETECKLQPPFLLAPDRVRPGVPLTQDEYDTVKDIVLDLLGWGVSPDDIITCGIAKETAYYVFNELNLRLPEQFDTSGLVPYTPESFPQSRWSQIPPPSLPGRRRDSIASSAASYCSPHHSPRFSTPSPRSNVILPTTSPLTMDPHDMERQKRQELMARKAVQASRKNKQLKSRISLPESPSMSLPAEQTTGPCRLPVAPTDTVEDFLNSIGTGESSSEILVPVNSRRISIDDAMDVDGYGTYARTTETDKAIYVNDLVSSPTAQDLSFVHPPAPPTEAQPLSVDSSISTFSQASQLPPPTPLESLGEPVSEPRFIMPRGIKRPVAADFVDFDPVPKRLETTNGSFNNGLISRPTSSANFRDVGLRRCVIDLSDSEGESEEQPSTTEDVSWNWRDKRAKSSKYPSPAPGKPLSGTMSPAALAQKELEIRKMRELIAQREGETRLRKLALSRSLNKDEMNNTGTSTPCNQSAHTLNRGEVDQVALAADDAVGVTAPSGPGPLDPPKASGLPSVHTASPDTLDDALNGSPVATHPSLHPELTEPDPPSKAQDALVDPQQVEFQETSPVFQMPAEGLVDAGWDPSPSTEAPLTTVLQKQDAKELPLSENFSANNEDVEDFLAYHSPFESYPLLHVGSRSGDSGQSPPSFSLSSHSSSHMYPSNGILLSFPSSQAAKPLSPSFTSSSAYLSSRLKPFKLATTSRLLDPTRRLCQYEVPGGGTCRDERCEDVHLSRLDGVSQLGVVEPSDEDSAEYLFNSLPRSWLADNDISTPSKILNVLRQVRCITLNEPLGFESRVARALRALERPAPT